MPTRNDDLLDVSIGFERMFKDSPCFISAQGRDFKIIAANQNFISTFGDSTGRYCYEVYKRRDSICPDCPAAASRCGVTSPAQRRIIAARSQHGPLQVRLFPVHRHRCWRPDRTVADRLAIAGVFPFAPQRKLKLNAQNAAKNRAVCSKAD